MLAPISLWLSCKRG